jgi:hypothetical protein
LRAIEQSIPRHLLVCPRARIPSALSRADTAFGKVWMNFHNDQAAVWRIRVMHDFKIAFVTPSVEKPNHA